jgi:hypothetical protein
MAGVDKGVIGGFSDRWCGGSSFCLSYRAIGRATCMTITILLAALGIVATVILGVWALIIALRHRYPGRITFVKEQTIALFDEIARNLPDLSVLYRQQPINANVVLVRAALVNDGKRDLAKSMVHRPVALLLPEGCKWLSPTVISSSRDVTAGISSPKEREVTISFDLLRCNEYIRFQVLAEVPATSADKGSKQNDSLERRFDKALKFDLRIEETQGIRRVPLRNTSRKPNVWIYRVMFLVGVALAVPSALVTFRSGYYKQLAFHFEQAPGRSTLVTVQPTGSSLSVRSLDGSYHALMAPNDFLKKCSGSPTVVTISRTRWRALSQSSNGVEKSYEWPLFVMIFGFYLTAIAVLLGISDLSGRKVRRVLTP